MKSNGDDYNPLAMLGGQLRKDGDDDPRSVFTFLLFRSFQGINVFRISDSRVLQRSLLLNLVKANEVDGEVVTLVTGVMRQKRPQAVVVSISVPNCLERINALKKRRNVLNGQRRALISINRNRWK